MGLRAAAGEEGESGSKNPGSLPGAGDPPGEWEALPEVSGAHWALLGAGDEAPSGSLIGPPQAGAAGNLGAQARGALSQPPDSRSPAQGLPAGPGPPARTSSVGSPWPPAAPRPCPPPEPSGTGRPARGCCVGRARPSCARKHASAARKLLETQRRPARPVTQGAGVGGLLQGLPGDGGGAGYFGLAPGRRHPHTRPGRPRPAPSWRDALAGQRAPPTPPLVPLPLSYKRVR